MKNLFFFAYAVAFGLLLSRAGATDYEVIQQMFLFESFQLYGFMGVGMAIIAPGLYLLKRHGRTLSGKPILVTPKDVHLGNVVGGAFFGIGWALTGMCPGPILVNIGEGKLHAIAAFVGALFGTWLLGFVYEKIAKPMGLPPLQGPPPRA